MVKAELARGVEPQGFRGRAPIFSFDLRVDEVADHGEMVLAVAEGPLAAMATMGWSPGSPDFAKVKDRGNELMTGLSALYSGCDLGRGRAP